MNLQYIEQLVYMRHTDLDRECPCHGELIELPDQRPTPQFSGNEILLYDSIDLLMCCFW